jgi:hypothetical protein
MRTLVLFALAAVAFCATASAETVVTRRTVTTTTVPFDVLRCESYGGRSTFCPADTRRGVSLVNNVNGRCTLGRSWGYTGRGVWVSNGCRGEFQIGRRAEGYGYGWGYVGSDYIVCASEDYRRSLCAAPTARGVRLVNQISEAPCVRGRTWWRDARGIVVTDGCAGEFQIGYRGDDYEWAPAVGGVDPYRPGTLTCRSNDGRRRYCQADIGDGAAQMVRQLSRAPCVYGRNWAYDHRGVWVADGCQAEFQVGYTTVAMNVGADSRWVRCESRDFRETSCAAPGHRGVTLVRQVSKSPCVKGDTWDFDRNRIWVTEGCAADFEVR